MIIVLARNGDPTAWLSELLEHRDWIRMGIEELSYIAV